MGHRLSYHIVNHVSKLLVSVILGPNPVTRSHVALLGHSDLEKLIIVGQIDLSILKLP